MTKKVLIAALLLTAVAAVSVSAAETGAPEVAPGNVVGAPILVLNRSVAELRATFMGISAEERAERAQEGIIRMMSRPMKGQVSVKQVPEGYAIALDGMPVFFVVSGDVDPLRQESLGKFAEEVAANLETVAREAIEARDLSTMVRSAGVAGIATMLLLLAVVLLNRGRGWILRRLDALAAAYSKKLSIGGASIIAGDRIFLFGSRTFTALYWFLAALLLFNWLSFVLGRFPYTRPLGEHLTSYMLVAVKRVGRVAADSVPGVFTALLILLGAKVFISLLNSLFDRMEETGSEVAGLDRDTIRPTRKLITASLWLFAIAMAYPYLPGSQTEAFKGLSVLVGVMVSLGGSSLVGQAASGLILMYTRTLRPGEYVQVSGNEGTVMDLGLFTTRIRTGLGEELTLPNALILGNTTHVQ